MSFLLETIKVNTNANDVKAIGKAIAGICLNDEDPKTFVPRIEATMSTATPEAKGMLSKILKRIEGVNAS